MNERDRATWPGELPKIWTPVPVLLVSTEAYTRLRAAALPSRSPPKLAQKASLARTPLSRAKYAERGLSHRGALDRTTRTMLLRQALPATWRARASRMPRRGRADARQRVLPEVARQDAARACLGSEPGGALVHCALPAVCHQPARARSTSGRGKRAVSLRAARGSGGHCRVPHCWVLPTSHCTARKLALARCAAGKRPQLTDHPGTARRSAVWAGLWTVRARSAAYEQGAAEAGGALHDAVRASRDDRAAWRWRSR